jgi:hypothetical protein
VRRRHLLLLGRAAAQRLEFAAKAAREQRDVVETLEAVIDGIRADVDHERANGSLDPRTLLTAASYHEAQRDRLDRLGADLAAAQGELGRRVDGVRDLFDEERRFDRLLELEASTRRRAGQRREAAFLDWLGERQAWRAAALDLMPPQDEQRVPAPPTAAVSGEAAAATAEEPPAQDRAA